MQNDKGFRFLVGCFVLFAGYQLWSNDVFGMLRSDGDQVESPDIIGLVIQALISAVDGVGYVAILLVSGLWPLVASALESLQGAMTKKPGLDLNDPRVQELIANIIAKQEKDEKQNDK